MEGSRPLDEMEGNWVPLDNRRAESSSAFAAGHSPVLTASCVVALLSLLFQEEQRIERGDSSPLEGSLCPIMQSLTNMAFTPLA